MLPLLLASAVLGSAPVGLTVSAQLGKSTTTAESYLRALEQEFLATELPVKRLVTKCEGARECLIDAAKAASLPGVVGVTLALGKKQSTIDLEALRVRDGAMVEQLTFVVKEKLEENERWQVRAFAKRVAAALEPPKVVVAPPTDTPVAATLTPVPQEDPLLLTQKPVEARSNAPAIIMGGAAGAAAITSGVFLGLATGARNELQQGTAGDPATLTRAQADQLAKTANTDYSVALGTGIAAGALAVGTVIYLLAK
jgi:hypothetical protein